MPPKDKRSKRARDAAELAKEYEISETFLNSAYLLNEIQQLQMQVEVLKNFQVTQPSSKIDPNIASVLTTLMESQNHLLERQIITPNIIQITSTNDMENSIQIFQGMDNTSEWIKEIEKISTLANWTNKIKSTNASI
ncbi:hypothetical protein AVEN_57849-1 [Araneus ventricosus]|uniref:Uncharacterized protein n=1 Tax=Araneus ventricosus TaxID=182803 RepID=A0A4Y2HNU8_ARAVE|nr:hypothetical protein AVEN_57849-1 [Araneus ventricosus]